MADPAATPPRFPQARGCPFHPPAAYARLHAEAPVTRITLPSGNRAWLITGYEQARRFLADPRSTADRSLPAYPAVLPRQPVTKAQAKGLLTWMDPPEHTEHRRMVVNEFTTRRLRQLQPRIQEIIDGCVDRMLATDGPVDLVEAFALPVPSLVICELLGVRYADRDLFGRYTIAILNRDTGAEDRVAAWRQLRVYLSDLVDDKVANPGEDLLSRLVLKYQDAGTFDHELMVGLSMALLVAGHETTANMIALGVLALLDHPDQRAALVADPSTAPQVVEELLRFFSIADTSTSRVTTADIELDGVVIPAGDGVIVLNSLANRDPETFADPDELDTTRAAARHHLAFGYGIHQCLGQNLARLELQLVFTTLFGRIPDLRLAVPSTELSYKEDATFYGVYQVPVTW
ncbi:cytochrome P450 [Actinokineospora inagensis]|uniref:cytochrome P450 n=1 Tax=Actinokineospora inagensis TaxID=103730 RepID=UPI00047D33E5|nr:cytochrome P450 [Actinokineospora inagensis]